MTRHNLQILFFFLNFKRHGASAAKVMALVNAFLPFPPTTKASRQVKIVADEIELS